jgi:hypothetical protein
MKRELSKSSKFYLCHECIYYVGQDWSKLSSEKLPITIDTIWKGTYCYSCGFWPAYSSIPTDYYEAVVIARMNTPKKSIAVKLANLVWPLFALFFRLKNR